MKVEFIFTGLCSFLNVDRHNDTMGDPGVIAVRTPHEHQSADEHHVTYIAYSTETTQLIGNDEGFEKVPKAEECRYLELMEAVEISIAGHAPGSPAVSNSYYDLLLRKDDYWPEAKDSWDRRYVPTFGRKPSPEVVTAYMRFGEGVLKACKPSQVKWCFPRGSNASYAGYFAEEVVYCFDQGGESVVIEFRWLGHDEDAAPIRTLEFAPLRRDEGRESRLCLFVGNNLKSDLAHAVRRKTTTASKPGVSTHFKYLNRIAGSGDGPLPTTENPSSGGHGDDGEGVNGGACGPTSGNR